MDCSREKFSVLGLLIWYGISGVECLDCYACVSKVWGTSAKAPVPKYGETVKEHKHKEFQIRVKLSSTRLFSQSLDGDKRCEDPVMPSYIEPLLNCTVPIPMYSNVTLNEGGYSLIGEEDKAISQATLPVAPPEGANWASAYDQGLQLTGQRSFWIFEHLDTTLG